ncbi:MAG: antitoxin family protein [Rubrobacter sp.]|nr:antitoxin family protein [Rubrobacter sp.]
MAQTLEAVFENGKFRLLEAPEAPLSQGQRVRITVETAANHDDILALAERVYEGLSEEEIEEIEEISLERRALFGGREG